MGVALPGPRDEAWKYTKAAQFLRQDWVTEPGEAEIELRGAARREDHAVEPLVGHGEGFVRLNAAVSGHRPALVVPEGQAGEIEIRSPGPAAGRLTAERRVIDVGPGGRLRLIERFSGAEPGFASAGLEVVLGRGAELEHVRIVDCGPEVVHHGSIGVEVGEGARYRLISVIPSVGTARIEPTVRLGGPGASAELFGLLALRAGQHGDHHVTIDHAAPRCTSRQVFRSLLDGKARGVFTGRVMVRRGAMGTDSAQVHRALLLSDDAIANARPQLEIDADDVKCAHGAAIGSLDAEALFFLRQRGLDPQQARALLTSAFASEIVAAISESSTSGLRVSEGSVRDEVAARMDAWLSS
jgi:Fe-S cluster assembly protein SufD